MDIAEAKARLEAVLDELVEAGFSVWGWDDESIQIGQLNKPSIACAPVTYCVSIHEKPPICRPSSDSGGRAPYCCRPWGRTMCV